MTPHGSGVVEDLDFYFADSRGYAQPPEKGGRPCYTGRLLIKHDCEPVGLYSDLWTNGMLPAYWPHELKLVKN
jgi:hypothetical protein